MAGLGAIARLVFGTPNERRIKIYQARIHKINALEKDFEKLSDEELKSKTDEFKSRLEKSESLDSILNEAFATVREAAKRTLGQRHYDVQLIGGLVLNENAIAEMKTGEGKTLVATLPTYLNALTGKGVHVVTVNDYLAKRDAEWMSVVYNFLGLSVGVITNDKGEQERRAAYQADITYGTNNEFGFDYLRDNMKYDIGAMVQRGHHYAIVDEVDSILIDEARTPLIISGPLDDKSDLYVKIDAIIPKLGADDYEIDEKSKTTILTEDGNERIEEILKKEGLLEHGSLYDVENITLVHHINQSLRAHKLFEKDRDYIVTKDQVIIVDEFTGRMMPGRRYSEGLHQALEAKEKVSIQPENQTLASITFQNYFRLYDKLAGMTGTAVTEADEFLDIYNLDVVSIPTNKPVARIDEDDEIYRTAEEKYVAIIDLIKQRTLEGQPILVGTTSIDKSEKLSAALSAAKIEHKVLNARYHEQEAHIIAQAGIPGAVTIATNMAGRGTDIKLGGNIEMRIEDETSAIEDEKEKKKRIKQIEKDLEEAKQKALDAGGLYIIGTERHESRRIDNQLRGRSGRQGDPGHSKFFLSLDDDLMRIFGSERMDTMLQRLGFKEGEALIHPWINKALEKAQTKVEARNFDIRKNLLKFDNVMNDQRKVIFAERRDLMDEQKCAEAVKEFRNVTIERLVSKKIPTDSYPEDWDVKGLKQDVETILRLDAPVEVWAAEEGIAEDDIEARLKAMMDALMNEKRTRFGDEVMKKIERMVVLQALDGLWQEHLISLDHLRQVIGWRGYAQRDPLNEYKAEAFSLFEGLIDRLHEIVTTQMMRVELVQAEEADHFEEKAEKRLETAQTNTSLQNNTINHASEDAQNWGKVPRNSPCPCGSGKKFKHCHGMIS